MENLTQKYGEPLDATNRIILSIFENFGKTGNTPAERIKQWANRPDIPTLSLRIKIERTYQKSKKLRREALKQFLDEQFLFPSIQPTPPSTSTSTHQHEQNTQPTTTFIQYQETPTYQHHTPPSSSKSPIKRKKFEKYEEIKEEKRLVLLKKQVKDAQTTLRVMKNLKGHYSEKNVRKREERSARIRTALRTERNEYRQKSYRQEKEITKLREEMDGMIKEMEGMRSKIDIIEKDLTKKGNEIDEVTAKKRKAEKRASFHMMGKAKLMKRLKDMEDSIKMDDEDRKTMEDGMYTEKVRMCVLELTALEVATGKISGVINCVSRNMFNTKFDQLPSRQACQNIVDEGHFLSKNVLGESLRKSKGWGLHKDGTTRKTVKILDTSVSMDDGSSFCLGFSAVASETGEAIADEAKEKIEEMNEVVSEEGFRKDVLEKLIYFMNDRAANEKKSSRLLEEWRKEMLQESQEYQSPHIHHLYCTAHVLLGFQSYTLKSLHAYNTTGQFKHPILTLLKDAADLFGPVGDYRGFRNIWEAFCIEKGLKSLIQNFKDNRFNGLFEVSAQVFFHHQEFIYLLLSKPTNNAKQTRLLKGLQNDNLILVLECLGLFFFKVTAPFWYLAISPKVSPSDLQTVVQQLHKALKKTQNDPQHFFNPNNFSFLDSFQSSPSIEAKEKLSNKIKNKIMAEIISKVSGALLDTLEAQMGDFLPGGKYGSSSAASALSNASFAPISNLLCERNFGLLDASQRRRPNASLHHHSSIVMLKQNKGLILKHLTSLTANRRKLMWAKARILGKALRKKHRGRDKLVALESLEKNLKKSARSNKNSPPPEPPLEVPVNKDQLVAIACEDCWYPAIVLDDCASEIKVDFAELGKGLGVFKWPNGRDVHTVSRKSVLAAGLEIEAKAGGRSWLVVNAKDVQAKFQK